jgi:Transglycosylase SLT domain
VRRLHVSVPLVAAALAALFVSTVPSSSFPVPPMGLDPTQARQDAFSAPVCCYRNGYTPTPATVPPATTTTVLHSAPTSSTGPVATTASPRATVPRGATAGPVSKHLVAVASSGTGSSGTGCPASIVALIESVWGSAAPWAVRIAWRESRCQPNAYNRSGAEGLFQLLGHADLLAAVGCPGRWADASCNIRAAFLLYQESGTRPWAL